MDEVGNILRDQREKLGYTLSRAEDRLKIQSRYLTALEEGRYDVLPTPVHVRGYLRNYAKFLELDPQPLLDSYQASANSRGGRVISAESGETIIQDPNANPFFNPVNVELNPEQSSANSESLLRIIVIVALLIAIGLVATRFAVNGRGDSLREGYDSIFNSEEQTVSEIVDNISTNETAPAESGLVVETGRGEVADEDIPTPIPELPTLTDLEIINIKLELTERAWLQITVDGEQQYQGQARTGEVFEFAAEDNVTVNTGNAFAIFVTINENSLGRLGERQEALEYSWNTSQ
ncbi:MAG: helix-turn-helix domain-containing protein [Candidatus Promineifilaceae bacterium]